MTRRIRYSDFGKPPAPEPAARSTAPLRLTPSAAQAAVPPMRPTPSVAMLAIPGAVLHGPATPRGARPTGPVLLIGDDPPAALRDRARERSGSVDLLLFRVGPEQFAVELAAVDEVVDLATVHHVPEMPRAMVGVVTVRDVLTPVYAPAAALGLPLATGASALVFRRGRARVALAIDDVDDVFTLDLALLRDAPIADDGDGVILGVVRQGDALIAVVDADALLAVCQAVPALEIA